VMQGRLATPVAQERGRPAPAGQERLPIPGSDPLPAHPG
jgi:hypothetical protein